MTPDQCADLAIAAIPEEVRQAFRDDPLASMAAVGLTVRSVPSLSWRRQGGGACDGVSFLQDNVVLYAPTPNSRRENFTVGHELGHWAVLQTTAVLNALADEDQPAVVVEAVCDRVAQRLLLPDDAVREVVGNGPVRAQHVLDLYDATLASRQVCAIGLAAGLRGLGAVLLTDRSQLLVEFASVHPDPEHGWPAVFPWSGQQVPPGHPLRVLSAGRTLTTRTFWRAPWGSTQDYYIDATHDGERVCAILSGADLWDASRLHIDEPRQFLNQPSGRVTCCGATRTAYGYPCDKCGGHRCPACGLCACEKLAATEQRCQRCSLMFRPHLLVEGLCEDCR